MADITTRAGKGAPLENDEVDANFTNLDDDKLEATDLSVSTGAASGGGTLSYSAGVFTFAPADLSSYITDLSAFTTTDLAEGTNLYYTNERVDDRVNALIVAGLGITTDYNDAAGTLTIESDTIEELCKNGTGSTILQGTPVYQTGTAGNFMEIAPADASSAATMPAVGVLAEDLTAGAEGTLLLMGRISGLDTSAFNEGDVIYVASGGGYTNTRPTGESVLVQNLGRVTKVNASNGGGVVMGSGRSNDVPNLTDGNIFIGNASGTYDKRAIVVADISDLTATATELNYTDGVTSNIQTQLNTKAPLASPTFTGTVTADGLSLGDNDKAIFGAGNDLQIYHDGTSSYIVDNGTGNLQIDANDFRVRKPDGSEAMIHANSDGAVKLFYDGGATPKLATTATGIDVTGNYVNSGHLLHNNNSGLKIIGGGDATNTGSNLTLYGGSNASAGTFRFRNGTATHLEVAGNGDISFYEDTGTTAKFFWDASAESLTLNSTLKVEGGTTNGFVQASGSAFQIGASTASNLIVYTNNSEAMRIDSSGNVVIGSSSTDGRLKLSAPSGHSNSSSIALYGNNGSAFGGSNVVRSKIDSITDGTAFGANMRFFTNDTSNVYQERLRIDSSGRVGINTSIPLWVLQTGNLRGTDTAPSFAGTGDGFAIDVYNEANPYERHISLAALGSGTTVADMSFYVDSGSAAVQAMTIASSGNVGIGTSSPITNLDILDTSESVLTLRASNSSGTRTAIRFQDGGTGTGTSGLFIGRSFGGNYIATNEAEPLIFTTNAAEAMRIDSSGNVGIGTSSPSSLLHVQGGSSSGIIQLGTGIREWKHIVSSSTGYYFLQDATAGSNRIAVDTSGNVGIGNTAPQYQLDLNTTGSNTLFGAGISASGSPLNLNLSSWGQSGGRSGIITFTTGSATNGSERMRIDSSGKVGIGMTPIADRQLSVYASGNSIFSLHNSTTGTGTGDGFQIQLVSDDVYLVNYEPDGVMRFYTAPSGGSTTERMRLDSSGNLLVGKTTASGSTQGAELRADGRLLAVSTSDFAGYFNRKTTDGEIVRFVKDTTTVGSIGVSGGALQISGNTNSGLQFNSSAFVPMQNGATIDATIDLGSSARRFKDLYLSGGVYLGGTGAANKLDDYEEGTFTPVVADAQDIGNTATGTFTGSYTKIGRLVIAEISLININTSGMTGTNDLYIRNFPFTNSSTSQGIVSFNSVTNSGAVTAYMTNSTAAFRLAEQLNNASRDMITVNQISSGTSDILVTLIYRT